MHHAQPSPTACEPLHADATGHDPVIIPGPDPPLERPSPEDPFQDQYCFFYGTLQDPDTLRQVLGWPRSPPILRRARVFGYEIQLWGPYPALVDKPCHSVNGMVSEPLSTIQLDRLAAYETDRYRRQSCSIEILNDDDEVVKTIEGVCFVWNGPLDKLRAGKFDLKEWRKDKLLQMLD